MHKLFCRLRRHKKKIHKSELVLQWQPPLHLDSAIPQPPSVASSSGANVTENNILMQDSLEELAALDELPTHASIVAKFGLYETDRLCNPQVSN